ncbi:hypothetical protein ONV78_29565 [Hahella sp. CR1]|uniref:DUF6160 family protein n=1 Tax=Hahella sp. CR1 TaxID=2992807 RepID=UPI0024421F99|nr:DUF6160 family protein [Hahella sp. CR1]MDG9671918.1 hypothetical protein [Hahella sp. CR1]
MKHHKPVTDNRLLSRAMLVCLALTASEMAASELRDMEEGELSQVTAQSGLIIEIPRVRINAHDGSLDDPGTPQDESDGRRTRGFRYNYITTEHDGGAQTYYFTDEISIAMDIEGPLKLDVDDGGHMVLQLPERVNFVGDGYSMKGIYLNNTGDPANGGKLLNEINIQGNFETGGQVFVWGYDP